MSSKPYVFFQGDSFLGYARNKEQAKKMGQSLSIDGEVRCEKDYQLIGYFRKGKFFKH